jgi:alkanesulfonate monooxygenase SsuD/methylene tetrahydromethanopterin reductase-like flavin-dependent oxidoreductase (luciferase family)
MEQLTVLAFLAGQTRTIRLVTSVIIVPHRNPLVAAKALATLDVLSKGGWCPKSLLEGKRCV